MQQTLRVLPVVAVLVVASGCASWNNKERGAAIGAAGGGVIGTAVGAATGSTIGGAIIGAVVGGTAGAVIGHQMDQQAKEIKTTVPGAIVVREGEGVHVTFATGLLFNTNSDDLREDARDNLANFAASLEKYPNTDVLIAGFTDNTGSAADNEALSARRAEAAANYLVSHGVARSRIRAVGRGEAEPVATNSTEAGRQQNRRVEVAVYANEAARNRAKAGGN
jgi:outer membrane protein OmpA-like peptidoglycan-associated protein